MGSCESLSSCIPVRVMIRMQALFVWMFLSLPSIIITLFLYFTIQEGSDNEGSVVRESNATQEFTCYNNYSVYYPIYEMTRFWVEGVLLVGVGLFGMCGNILTVAVLANSKNTKFNRLLLYLSVSDTFLILFFLLVSICTVLTSEPQWFVILFPHVLWPLGNIAITASVLMVIAVSTERFLAICRPMQYKPSPRFYVLLVLLISVSVNIGRFLEFKLVKDGDGLFYYEQSFLMQNEHYVVFSRYWIELIVTGTVPLLGLSILNMGIYLKIKNSNKFRKLHEKTCHLGRRKGARSATLARQAPSTVSSDRGLPAYHHSSFASLPPAAGSRLMLPANGSNNNTPTTPIPTPSHAPHATSSSSSSERSTKVLVGIVLVFVTCHSMRLFLQVDAVFHPSIMGGQHFNYCMKQGRFASPFIVWIFTSCNNIFLVINSSINFVVYCFVGRTFRATLVDIFRLGFGLRKRRRRKRMMDTTRGYGGRLLDSPTNADLACRPTMMSTFNDGDAAALLQGTAAAAAAANQFEGGTPLRIVDVSPSVSIAVRNGDRKQGVEAWERRRQTYKNKGKPVNGNMCSL